MSRMACVENIYDVLVGEGLRTDHACFDDLVIGCSELVAQDKGTDIVSVLAEMDEDRDETTIALDIYEYVRNCGSAAKPTAIIAKAVAAGMAGWEQ